MRAMTCPGRTRSPSSTRTCSTRPSTSARTLARRAYRRPVDKDDIDALYAFYEKGRTGGTFEIGIQVALERLLATYPLIEPQGTPVGVRNSSQSPDICTIGRKRTLGWSR